MNIPSYWSEHTIEFAYENKRSKNKTTKIKRYGWSNTSQAEAKEHAIERCQQAKQTLLATGKVKRVEGKDSYLDKTDLPIREQVLHHYADLNCVTTVNSYGATCLNVENVMILDIDNDDITRFCWRHKFIDKPFLILDKIKMRFVLFAIFLLAVIFLFSVKPFTSCVSDVVLYLKYIIWAFFSSFFIVWALFILFDSIDDKRMAQWLKKQGGELAILEMIINKFLEENNDFAFNIYQTPLGFRLIALQDTFFANDDKTQLCFNQLPVDSCYAKLCQVQNCFRARVTAKPWRIEQDKYHHPQQQQQQIEPRIPNRYFWLNNDKTKERNEWLQSYHQLAKNYSACHFIKCIGQSATHSINSPINEQVAKVVQLYDDLCRSHRKLPLA
ncbi:hypothetical protein [Psychrobacter sp. I-STPA10]|uniref:hypothetical protein n=1 Tax=Psychrobacter sp. I-STPA10 TaxID=2585769 RepID=UPI001E59DBC3|nr:hypothetical protein [Psychrobacter sp. I-STPA10]